ncbi:non-ribosomal peptide synthetase [Microbulbifer elongatus]|uniref:non-ribosomal peptide synthetase n=1 Tax=Microbulbifer elongatus TaxID=86173 RepID=UPI001E55BE09|nr:non-ribosomal peptide synthetase [Microbulbifer elongatus]
MSEQWIPLTSTQEGIWYADKVSSDHTTYVIAHCLELPGDIDVAILRDAIGLGLSEADTVTAIFDSEKPRQRLQGQSENPIPEAEFSDLTSEDHGAQKAWDEIRNDTRQPLDATGNQALTCQRIYRVLDNKGTTKTLWYQRYHHINLDGYSFATLTRRIAEIYTAMVRCQPIGECPFIGADAVVQDQTEYKASAKWAKNRDFWSAYLDDAPQPASLRARPITSDNQALSNLPVSNGEHHTVDLPENTMARLHQCAQEQGVRLAAPDLLMGLLVAYLARISGQFHQIVGVPFMGRMGSVAIRSLAPVVNVLPVKVHLDAGMDLIACATAFKKALAQVRPHQRYPAEQIQRERSQGSAGQSLYGPVINYKPFDLAADFAGCVAHTHALATGPVDDLEIGVLVHGRGEGGGKGGSKGEHNRLQLDLRADSRRYSAEDLQRHGARLRAAVDNWLSQPAQTLSQLDFHAPGEQAEIARWSRGRRFGLDAARHTIADWLTFQAEERPRGRALVFSSANSATARSLNFLELQQAVARLTRLLISRAMGPGKVVALAAPRSVESVVAIFAVLNSGATLLPIDLEYPAERIEAMCEDACPSLLLASADSQIEAGPDSPLCKVTRLNLDQLQAELEPISGAPLTQEERLAPITQDTIAYVIFTSGSTGRPKGVMNTQGALLNLFQSHRESYLLPAVARLAEREPGRSLRAAHTHTFSFDSSWVQFFWLLLGQELHMFDEELRRDAEGLVQKIQQQRIDALDLPPSLLAQMLNCGLFAAGKHRPLLLAIGGEAAPAALWQQLRTQQRAQPWLDAQNLYGPTEYTVDALRAPIAESAQPVVGRPVGNTAVYVLDAHLQPLPVGAVGELYLSGAGLARGYLARGGLTAGRFIADPFASSSDNGVRMYRTGDLVRWNSSGQLEFLGRSDDQIKVRGHRVELGEVENALSLLPQVESAVVIAEPVNHSHRLIGCCAIPGVGASERHGRAQDLQAQLRKQLPEYAVPALLLVLDNLPRNMSGKVDRRALLQLARENIRIGSGAGEPPRTAGEKLLCEAIAEVLQLSPLLGSLQGVGAEDDFFSLGGDSITAIVLCTRLRDAGQLLKPSQIFSLRTARQLALQLQPLQAEKIAAGWSLPAQEEESLRARHGDFEDAAPVLPLQQGMLFHVQATSNTTPGAEHNSAYNAFTRLTLKGALDPSRLQRALNAVLTRHPQLAGLFDSETCDEPRFLLPPSSALQWPWRSEDLSNQTPVIRAQRLQEIEREMLEQQYPADRFAGMLGAALVRTGNTDYRLLLVTHHLVIDGWSTPLLLQDLISAYREDRAQLPPLPVGYAQVVGALAARDNTGARALWQRLLDGVQPCVLFEQADTAAPVAEFALQLPAEQTAQLNREIRARGLTLNAVMQGVWAQLLSGLSGREDIVIGTPVSGRTAPIAGIEDQVGLFLNTLPVRVALDPSASLWAQTGLIQQRHSEVLENDGLGLVEIQQLAGSGQLFDTLLVVENYPLSTGPDSRYLDQQLTGTDGEPLVVGDIHNRGYSHYPLALLVIPGEELTLLVENRGAVADAAWIAERARDLLIGLIEQPERPLQQTPLLSASEQLLIDGVNDTELPLPARTLRDLLHAQARHSPDAPALVDARDALSYSEVRTQVQTLARELVDAGVRPGGIVAVALPRSVRLSLALLAVIEVGAAYLPLDLGYPDERLEFMLQDADAKLLITDGEQRARFAALSSTPLLVFDHLREPPAHSEFPLPTLTAAHPAYLIYTSGTTGRPKGVLVTHSAIVNRILWMQQQYVLTSEDVVLQKTPCSFDVSVWEFFWPLMVGARLVMAEPDAHRDPQQLAQTIDHFGVSCLHFVPSMLALFTEHFSSSAEKSCPSLRLVFASGEALTRAHADAFAARFGAQLHNLYGPTEAAVDVSYFSALTGDFSGAGAGVPIGRPVWNTQLRVLDHRLRPVPVGATGELYLCGVQLALGYLGRAGLSAGRFVADPYSSTPGARMYRTGDLVRWLPGGDIEYLGRADDQIKIRGLRVELGEIETQLLAMPEIANAVVSAISLGTEENPVMDSRQLVAYLIASQDSKPPEIAVITAHLAASLPAHMVPVAYVFMDAFPLSANGKLDRRALPLPEAVADQQRDGRMPARGVESRIAEIFARLLQREQVFADDDFFALGGHSLLAMRLAAEIRRELQRPVSVGQIITAPTVEQLAANLKLSEMLSDFGSEGFDAVLPLRAGSGKPLICFYPGSGFAWQYSVLTRYIDSERPVMGLQSPRPGGLIATSADMEALIARQLEIVRRVQPTGPYYLLGYSLGGSVAYGVAAALRALGEEVAFLGLLDTYPAEVHDWSDPEGAEAAVGAEREQTQLLQEAFAGGDGSEDESLRAEREAILQQIFANYQDAVRLLSQARTPVYDGRVTLFVAEQSLPEYINPEEDWRPLVGALDVHRLAERAHDDILSPESLETLGPLLDRLIKESEVASPESLDLSETA